MHRRILALSSALLMAILAGQGFLLQSNDTDAADTAGPHAASVIAYTVFSNGCAGADLHVMRYIPADSTGFTPLVATWCA
jgi:hypothetical protein